MHTNMRCTHAAFLFLRESKTCRTFIGYWLLVIGYWLLVITVPASE